MGCGVWGGGEGGGKLGVEGCFLICFVLSFAQILVLLRGGIRGEGSGAWLLRGGGGAGVRGCGEIMV